MSEVSDKLLIVLMIVAIGVSLFGTTATVSKLSNLGGNIITGQATATPTGVANVTIPSLVYISLPTSSIDFGSVEVNVADDTTDNNPLPFTLQNDGSKNVNVTIGAANLFTGTGASNPSSYYQFSSAESESGSVINTTLDLISSATNMPATGSPVKVASNLRFPNAYDIIKVHMYITVPNDEPAGAKSSTVTFTASQA